MILGKWPAKAHRRKPKKDTGLMDAIVAEDCRLSGLPAPSKEVRFHLTRKWRLDYAVTLHDGRRLAIEVEGGVWTNGRHNRATGFLGDMEKYNTLAVMGYSLLRLTPDQIHTGELLGWLKQIAAPHK